MTIGSHNRHFTALGGAVAGALLLSGCAGMGKAPTTTLPPPDAHAQLYDASGADRGRADIYRDGSGLRIELVARVQARCPVPFAELARIRARLAEWQVVIEREDFDAAGAGLLLSLPAERLELLRRQLGDLSRGQIVLAAC